MTSNPFQVGNACLGQTYILGPAMDQSTLRSAAIIPGHVGILGADRGSCGIQGRHTIAVSSTI